MSPPRGCKSRPHPCLSPSPGKSSPSLKTGSRPDTPSLSARKSAPNPCFRPGYALSCTPKRSRKDPNTAEPAWTKPLSPKDTPEPPERPTAFPSAQPNAHFLRRCSLLSPGKNMPSHSSPRCPSSSCQKCWTATALTLRLHSPSPGTHGNSSHPKKQSNSGPFARSQASTIGSWEPAVEKQTEKRLPRAKAYSHCWSQSPSACSNTSFRWSGPSPGKSRGSPACRPCSPPPPEVVERYRL